MNEQKGDYVPPWAVEMKERLARLETKIDRYNNVRDTAYEAKQKALENERDIQQLQADRQWLYRLVIGALIMAFIGFATSGAMATLVGL